MHRGTLESYGSGPFGNIGSDMGKCFKHAINPTHGSTEKQLDVVIQGVYDVSQVALHLGLWALVLPMVTICPRSQGRVAA